MDKKGERRKEKKLRERKMDRGREGERERGRKREIFPVFRLSNLDGPRVKVNPRNEGYVWGTKIWEYHQTPSGRKFSYFNYF